VSLAKIIEYEQASPEVKVVYDDIMKTRGVDWINNFWKVLANDPALLARVWAQVKQVMAPGALDPLVKEMVYVAVSATNGCEYCTYSHTAAARKKGRPRQPDQPPRERLARAGRPAIHSLSSTLLPSGVTR
jgi:AhpD family alkylhydroperoxidase